MDGQARVLVFFRGQIDAVRLARAVRLTLEAEPILAHRYVDDPRRPFWQLVDEKDWNEVFSMMECLPSDPRVYDFMVETVDPEQAPQIRVRLFRSMDDMVCIRSNHLILDGGGVIHYTYLLASIYRELEKDPGHRPRACAPQRPGPRQVIKEAGIIPTIGTVLNVRLPGASWGIPRVSDDHSRKTFLVRWLGAEDVTMIQAYAREREVTINDVLLTAFCRSLFTILDPPQGKKLMVEVPLNLRRHLPDVHASISDLSAVYLLAIHRQEKESFEDTLRRVHFMVDNRKKCRTELAEMLLLELLLLPGPSFLKRLMEMVGFRTAHPALSNLGVIDDQKVDFGNIAVKDLHLIGPVLYPPNIGLGAYTFRHRICFNLNYVSSAVDPQLMERFFDHFLKELPGSPSSSDPVRIPEDR